MTVVMPPSPDTLSGKCCGISTRTDVHVPGVMDTVIDTIGYYFLQVAVFIFIAKVIGIDYGITPLSLPGLTIILVVTG